MGGGATRALNIVECLSQRSYDLQMVTSVPHYPLGPQKLDPFHISEEKDKGLIVIRLPSLGLLHGGFLGRLINYCWYALFCLVSIGKIRYSDVVICLGPHPFTDFPAFLFKKVKGARMILDISDLWPEAISFKSSFVNSLIQGIGYSLNKLILRFFSDGICVLNERALNFIINRYDYEKPATVVYNITNTDMFVYDHKAKKEKKALKGLVPGLAENKFVILYHGILGSAQKIENIVKAAKLAQSVYQILFVIIGEGEKKEIARKLAEDEHLNNIVFLPMINRKLICKIVAESDLGLLPIVSSTLHIYILMTSKAAEFLASGTPLLAPVGSYIGKLVSSAGAGFEIDFAHPDQIYQSIKWVFDHPLLFDQMKERARKIAVERFSQNHFSKVLCSFVEAIGR
jgi:glycosyltransferase involved in cell wall biosynthesis